LKQKSPIKTPQFMSSANSSKSSTKKSILQKSLLKLSINSTKSSGKQTPLSERNEKTKNKIKQVKTKSIKNIKTVKPLSHSELKKNIDNSRILKEQDAKILKNIKHSHSPGSGIFGDINVDSFEDSNVNMNVMLSAGKLNMVSESEKSRCETPPLFDLQWNSGTKSLIMSESLTPLDKLVETKAVKRVKLPKITVDEEIKKMKRNNK
jgi:hypothetical protein